MRHTSSLSGSASSKRPLSKHILIGIALVSVSVGLCLAGMFGIVRRTGSTAAPATQKPQPLSLTDPVSAPSVPASNPLLQTLTGLQDAPVGSASPRASPTTIRALRAQVQRDPGNVAARVRLAVLLGSQGDDSEAEDVLRVALQRRQHSPEIYHALGMLYLHNKQYKPAAQAFAVEAHLHPNDFQAHLNLAMTYVFLTKSDHARSEFEAAQKIDPAAPDTYLGMAFLNNSSERYPYAIKYLNEYIRRSPEPGRGYALMSRVYLNMKLYEQAITAGQTATLKMPDNANVWYTLGQAYSYGPGDQHLADAARAFERTLQLNPQWVAAHFELGHVYARQNRPADAILQYRESIRYGPDRGKSHYQLGQLLLQQGQTDEGKKELQKAQTLIRLNQRQDQLEEKVSAMPDNPRYLFEMAQLYKEVGKYSQAESWFQAALQIAPHYPQAREQLAEVRRLMALQQPSRQR
jgi:tetratricopeptide (TPR) repeat protein